MKRLFVFMALAAALSSCGGSKVPAHTGKSKLVILGFDGPDGEAKRKIYRPAHLAKMEPLDAYGKVVLAGPLTDKTGSLIVIEADSLEDAQQFAREDPYTVHGVFERIEVHPFTQVFPKER